MIFLIGGGNYLRTLFPTRNYNGRTDFLKTIQYIEGTINHQRRLKAPESHSIEINGLNIHYLDYSASSDTSKTLLLVHGIGGTAAGWHEVAQILRRDFRVLAIDQRGHGDSNHAPTGYAVTSFASDLATFAVTLNIIPYDYCGLSLGARNGIAYAGNYSDHLSHLVLLDLGPEISKAALKLGQSTRAIRKKEWNTVQQFVEDMRIEYPGAPDEYIYMRGETELTRNYDGVLVPKADPELSRIISSLRSKEQSYLWESWSRISCPLMVLRGDRSPYIDESIAKQMKELQPSLHFLDVPNSNHSIPAYNSDFLVDHLRRFLLD